MSNQSLVKSENLTLDVFSLAISDKFPNFVFEFVEHDNKTNQSYTVKLKLKNVKYIDKERIILSGNMIVASSPFGNGTIEYQFNTGEFYRVLYSNKTTKSRRLNTLIVHNQEKVNELLGFISNYLL